MHHLIGRAAACLALAAGLTAGTAACQGAQPACASTIGVSLVPARSGSGSTSTGTHSAPSNTGTHSSSGSTSSGTGTHSAPSNTGSHPASGTTSGSTSGTRSTFSGSGSSRTIVSSSGSRYPATYGRTYVYVGPGGATTAFAYHGYGYYHSLRTPPDPYDPYDFRNYSNPLSPYYGVRVAC